MLSGLFTKHAVAPEVYPLVAVTCGVHFVVSRLVPSNSSSNVQVHEPLTPSGVAPAQPGPVPSCTNWAGGGAVRLSAPPAAGGVEEARPTMEPVSATASAAPAD